MQFTYIIIDHPPAAEAVRTLMNGFDQFLCVAVSHESADGINKVLELKPDIVFLSVESGSSDRAGLSFSIISELNEYFDEVPFIVILSDTVDLAYEAFQRGASGFLLKPLEISMLRKCLYRYQRTHAPTVSKRICIKSQGDYHFVKANEIVYLKADNNTTDFYIENGKIISAFKTLKYFENLLPSYFYRIHNSYVINIDFVSRINLGKSDCYLSNNKIILPFSRTYKSSIDSIIAKIS